MKALLIVVIEYRHRLLRDDWSGVHPLIHKMDGYSTHFCPVGKGVRHWMRAGESGQKRWMDIKDPIPVFLDKRGFKQLHKTG